MNVVAAFLFDGLVHKYDGVDPRYTFFRWVQDIDDNAEIFGWTSAQKLIVPHSSLTGTAELWLKSEKVFKTYDVSNPEKIP